MVLARKYQIKFLNIWTFSYFLGWKYYKIPWVKGPSSKQSPWIAKIWQLVWHISKMSLVLHTLNMGRLNIHCMGHCSPYSYCSVVPITRCDCRGNLPQRHIKKILSIHEKKFQKLFKHFCHSKVLVFAFSDLIIHTFHSCSAPTIGGLCFPKGSKLRDLPTLLRGGSSRGLTFILLLANSSQKL